MLWKRIIIIFTLWPIKTNISNDSGHFFITFTCYGWLPLIEITNSYDLVYNWFDILKKDGHHITGYVIMPNHIHASIAFRKTKKTSTKLLVMANGLWDMKL